MRLEQALHRLRVLRLKMGDGGENGQVSVGRLCLWGVTVNLIFLMADSLRKDHLGCYGNRWISTPHIDHVARDSVVFDEAYAESLPTLPVRNVLLSGRHCGPELAWGPMRDSDVRLPEVLADVGYQTALVSDVYHMMKPGMNFHRGFHTWLWIRGQGQDAYRTSPNPNAPVPETYCLQYDKRLLQFCKNVAGFAVEEDYFTARVYGTAMKWIERNWRNGPFFLWLDSFDPHEPWYPPYHYSDMYDPDYEGVEPIGLAYGKLSPDFSDRQLKRMRAHYAGEVTFLDRWVGKLVELLGDLGIYQDTLLVLMSDHGHMLGEHDLVGKGWETSGYREVMDLTLIVHFPGDESAGTRVGCLCYNIDLIPTVLSHLGVTTPQALDGIDLHDAIKRESTIFRQCVTCSFSRLNMMVKTMNWTMLYDQGHEPIALFDRLNDPQEESDVRMSNATVIHELQRLESEDWANRPPKR